MYPPYMGNYTLFWAFVNKNNEFISLKPFRIALQLSEKFYLIIYINILQN